MYLKQEYTKTIQNYLHYNLVLEIHHFLLGPTQKPTKITMGK